MTAWMLFEAAQIGIATVGLAVNGWLTWRSHRTYFDVRTVAQNGRVIVARAYARSDAFLTLGQAVLLAMAIEIYRAHVAGRVTGDLMASIAAVPWLRLLLNVILLLDAALNARDRRRVERSDS